VLESFEVLGPPILAPDDSHARQRWAMEGVEVVLWFLGSGS
jgi:hypothetical protein